MEQQYNKTSGPELTNVLPGMNVTMQTEKGWVPAQVLSKCKEPRSYIVRSPDGGVYRRNRKHLKDQDARTEDYPITQASPHKVQASQRKVTFTEDSQGKTLQPEKPTSQEPIGLRRS